MENYGEGVRRGWRMVRRGPYKLTYVPGCESELYNLADDPDEWHNLIHDTRLQDVRRELEALAMEAWEPDRCDEQRWQSEERRLAILKTGQTLDWHKATR
jgi:choline-sulfatase